MKMLICPECGNVAELLHDGGGDVVCCDMPMEELKENSVDAAKEKHVPVMKTEDDKTVVNIGEVDHPMADNHFIQWIELHHDGIIERKSLKPCDKPRAVFNTTRGTVAKAYCNLHGFWKG